MRTPRSRYWRLSKSTLLLLICSRRVNQRRDCRLLRYVGKLGIDHVELAIALEFSALKQSKCCVFCVEISETERKVD